MNTCIVKFCENQAMGREYPKCDEHTGQPAASMIRREWEIEDDLKVIDKMIKHGGSFVQALGEAFRHADRSNFAKLKNAFPEYWEKYKNF